MNILEWAEMFDDQNISIKQVKKKENYCNAVEDKSCDKEKSEESTSEYNLPHSEHRGLKYSCPYCSYEATREKNLKRHTETIHEGVKYSCPHCSSEYTRRAYLQKHIAAIHEG